VEARRKKRKSSQRQPQPYNPGVQASWRRSRHYDAGSPGNQAHKRSGRERPGPFARTPPNPPIIRCPGRAASTSRCTPQSAAAWAPPAGGRGAEGAGAAVTQSELSVAFAATSSSASKETLAFFLRLKGRAEH